MKADELIDRVLIDIQHPRFAERLAQFLQTAAADDPRRQRVEELLELARQRRAAEGTP